MGKIKIQFYKIDYWYLLPTVTHYRYTKDIPYKVGVFWLKWGFVLSINKEGE